MRKMYGITQEEELAVRFYMGDPAAVRSGIWRGGPAAYNTINALLHPGSSNERDKAAEGRHFGIEDKAMLEEYMQLIVCVFSAMVKYRNAVQDTSGGGQLISWRIDRASSLESFAADGGLIAGFFRLKSYGFGAYSLTNVLLFLGVDKDYSNFIRALILLAIMAVLSFIGVFMTKYDDSVYETPAAQNKSATNSTDDKEPAITADAKLASPCKGTFIAMKDIHDDAIASGALGQCFGIKPEDSTITSPISGTINSVAPTKHAYTIYGDHGEQVMVHIGIDSMKMNGAGLASFVRPGMHVKAGDKIASYQRTMFKAEHIDDTVVTILLNSKDYKEVTIDENNKDQTLTAKM